MSRVITFLTFPDRAEEAVQFYVSLFPNSHISNIVRYAEEGVLAEGALLNAEFVLDGQPFMAMTGGPSFHFAPGISLMVNCETQAEVDRLWEALADGGEEQPCGWVQDRFGVSWQIVPTALGELMQGADADGTQRVMQALLQMHKIDGEALRAAYAAQPA